MLDHPLHDLPGPFCKVPHANPSLAAALLRRLADPRQGAPAAIVLLARLAAQHGPGWTRLTLTALLDWLAQPCISLATAVPPLHHDKRAVPVSVDGDAGSRPRDEAVVEAERDGSAGTKGSGQDAVLPSGMRHGLVNAPAPPWICGDDDGGFADGGGRGRGGPCRALEVRQRLALLPAQLRPQLRRLLEALSRCAVLYDSLDERSRALLRQLLTAAGGREAVDPRATGPSWDLPAGAATSGVGSRPVRDGTVLGRQGGGGLQKRGIADQPATERDGSRRGGGQGRAPPGEGSGLGRARGWVAAAMQASRLRYQRAASKPPTDAVAHDTPAGIPGTGASDAAPKAAIAGGGISAAAAQTRTAASVPPGDQAGAGASVGNGDGVGGGFGVVEGIPAGGGGGGWWWIPDEEPYSDDEDEEDEEEEEDSGSGSEDPPGSEAPTGALDRQNRGTDSLAPTGPGPAAEVRRDGGGELAASASPVAGRTAAAAAGGAAGANVVAGRTDADRAVTGAQAAVRPPEPPSPRPAKRPRTDNVGPGAEGGGRALGPPLPLPPPLSPARQQTAAAQGPLAGSKDGGEAGAADAAGNGVEAAGRGGRAAAADVTWPEVLRMLQDAASSAGNDPGPGNTATPWQRIESLLEQCAAGPHHHHHHLHDGASVATAAGLPPLPPDAVSYIVRQLVTQRLGGAAARLLLGGVVLPAVAAVERVMPRPLQEAMAAAAGPHPRPLTEAVLVPAARRPGLTAGQAQLLVKVATTGRTALPRPLQALVLRSAAGVGGEWSETHVAVVQGLTEAAKEDMDPETLAAVANGLSAAAASRRLAASVPLCRLLLLLLSRFGPGLSAPQLRQLQEAATATSTFMTKPCQAKLGELLAGAAAR